MPRRRAAESVPEVEHDIEEVIIRHRKNKRGAVRTQEKSIPIVIPNVDAPRQSERLRNRKLTPLDRSNAEGSQRAMPTMSDTQTSHFMDDPMEEFLNLETETDPPQASVCIQSHICSIENLIEFRL
jgi:hypothetical protein